MSIADLIVMIFMVLGSLTIGGIIVGGIFCLIEKILDKIPFMKKVNKIMDKIIGWV